MIRASLVLQNISKKIENKFSYIQVYKMSSIDRDIIKANTEIEEILVKIKEAHENDNTQAIDEMIHTYNSLVRYKGTLVKKRMMMEN